MFFLRCQVYEFPVLPADTALAMDSRLHYVMASVAQVIIVRWVRKVLRSKTVVVRTCFVPWGLLHLTLLTSAITPPEGTASTTALINSAVTQVRTVWRGCNRCVELVSMDTFMVSSQRIVAVLVIPATTVQREVYLLPRCFVVTLVATVHVVVPIRYPYLQVITRLAVM